MTLDIKDVYYSQKKYILETRWRDLLETVPVTLQGGAGISARDFLDFIQFYLDGTDALTVTAAGAEKQYL